MSSETSIEVAAGAARSDAQAFHPWQFFTLAGLAAATAVVFVSRDAGPAGVILLSITVGAAAWVGLAAWRTLAPLAGHLQVHVPQILAGRTRAAIEREKTLVLRSIKDLEFDRVMGKVSDRDFAEMSARLRSRAAGLIRQLDSGSGYRDEIEKELAKRIGSAPPAAIVATRTCTCGVTNDPDAKFCKNCGSRIGPA
jgi:hypothetical protein